MAYTVKNFDEIKEFLYHSLKDDEIEHLDEMFTNLDGQNFSKSGKGFIDIAHPKIEIKGVMTSAPPSSLHSVRLKNPKIYVLYPDHKE